MSTSPGSPSTPSLQGCFSRWIFRGTQHLIPDQAAGYRSSSTELLSYQPRAACPNSTTGTFPEQQTTSAILLPPSPSGEPSLRDYQMRPTARLRVFCKCAPKHQGCSRNGQIHSPELLQPSQSSPVQVRISCFEAEASSEVCSFILKETCSTKSSITQHIQQTHHLQYQSPLSSLA